MEAEGQAPGCAAVAIPENGPLILVVDDDASLRMLFERYLTVLGYPSVFAGSGNEAVLLACKTPAIRLMILDVMMPGLSGQHLALQLVALLPDAAVLFCSGHPASALARLGIDIEGAQFMQKPCRPLELQQRLREMLVTR